MFPFGYPVASAQTRKKLSLAGCRWYSRMTGACRSDNVSVAAADACSALPAGSLAGSAVLVRRGTCSFFIKATNAQNAGAAAVVLYNNTAGALAPTVAGTPAITIRAPGSLRSRARKRGGSA